MKLLCLIRHARAGAAAPSVDDFDRPLSPRGEEDARALGRRLARAAAVPALVFASPARRAERTAELVAASAGWPADCIRCERALYLAASAPLLEQLRGLDDALGEVALVGHNPGLSELASRLLGWDAGELAPAGAVLLRLRVAAWRETADGCAERLLPEDGAERA